ncbi:hypothetical protein J1614_001729 [Plenodomus biglobosus]|nr:hypothetical protein J1614_001729 [Plenodomus biglobosus]
MFSCLQKHVVLAYHASYASTTLTYQGQMHMLLTLEFTWSRISSQRDLDTSDPCLIAPTTTIAQLHFLLKIISQSSPITQARLTIKELFSPRDFQLGLVNNNLHHAHHIQLFPTTIAPTPTTLPRSQSPRKKRARTVHVIPIMPPKIPKAPKGLRTPKTPSITVKALQSLLTRIGSTSSGTKPVLYSRFLRDLSVSRIRNSHSTSDVQQTGDWNRKLRIVSIDMGIKNLAFCEAEVSYPGCVKGEDAKEATQGWDAVMEVIRWEKIDLVANARDLRGPAPSGTSKGKASKKGIAIEEADEDADPYSLSVLSETAYRLIKSTILSAAPDVILIEKQRWRSGGGSAVQQWTVRVNTLEGMLWAVLATLKGETMHIPKGHGETHPHAMKAYEVFAVDPKRVGQYWLQQEAQVAAVDESKSVTRALKSKAKAQKAGNEVETEDEANVEINKAPTRSKAEKKAKINMLRSWLSSNSTSTSDITGATTTTPTITFKLGPSTQRIRQALCSPTKTVRRRKKSEEEGDTPAPEAVVPEKELRKLDDVTDCFLQAAAWVSWEANRRQLQDVRLRRGAGDGATADVDDAVLLAMVREIGQA